MAGIGVAATIVETTDEQWQRVIYFIASDDGRFINGSELVMDGGMTAR